MATASGWQTVLVDVHNASSAMLAELDERERVLDAFDANESALDLRRAQNGVDSRLQKLSERIEAAEQTVDDAGKQLAAAENGMRAWAERVEALRMRLTAFAAE